MKLKSLSFGMIIAAVILSLGVPFTAEAQFLNKLSKGLEKVNKTLDKVEKTVDKRPNQQHPAQTIGSQKLIMPTRKWAWRLSNPHIGIRS